MSEHSYSDFEMSLAAGKLNERVIAHEFQYQSKPLIPTGEGKQPFDFFLPDGRSVEVKLDLRSQCTGSGIIERPTLDRHPDFVIQTFTQARVFPGEWYEKLYFTRGKIPNGGVGQYGYDARLIWHMWTEGTPLYQFIKSL